MMMKKNPHSQALSFQQHFTKIFVLFNNNFWKKKLKFDRLEKTFLRRNLYVLQVGSFYNR